MCILIINAKIWTTYILFVEQCMHLVYQEIHLKPFLYMWTIKHSKNRKHRCFSLCMIFSCTANRKPELCTYTPITYSVLKKQYNIQTRKKLKRFLRAFLKIYWQISMCDFVFFPNMTAENHPPTKRN